MKYQKIPTVFKRDPRNPKQFTDEFANPEIAALADVPMWVFTEKVDGTNVRIEWDGHRVTFEGRTDVSTFPSFLQDYLDERFGTPEFENIMEQTFGEKTVTIIGEGYGDRIQSVGKNYLGTGNVSFVAFDIAVDGFYLAHDSTVSALDSLGIDQAPVWEGGNTITEAIEYVKTVPHSTWGDFPAEGLVGKTRTGLLDKRGERIIVKVKVRDFA